MRNAPPAFGNCGTGGKFMYTRLKNRKKIMNYCNVPVVRFYVEGDDGLNYEADDDSSFDDTDDLLNTLRIRNPTEKFYMLAVIDA